MPVLGGIPLSNALPVAVILAGGTRDAPEADPLRDSQGHGPHPRPPVPRIPSARPLCRGNPDGNPVRGIPEGTDPAYFGDGLAVGLAVRYAEEAAPLGTAGALGNARGMIGDTSFLLMNGDTYVSVDYKRLAAYHRGKVTSADAIGTMVVARVSDGSASGRILLEEDGRIRSFREKEPRGGSPCVVNAGVYFFEPDIFRFIPETIPASLEHDSIPALLDAGRALYGFPAGGDFIDIGTREKETKRCPICWRIEHLETDYPRPGEKGPDPRAAAVGVGDPCDPPPPVGLRGNSGRRLVRQPHTQRSALQPMGTWRVRRFP